MSAMQDKLLGIMRAKVTSTHNSMTRVDEAVPSPEFVDQQQFGNTGTVYVQRGLETFLLIRYNFQHTYVTFTFAGRAVLLSETATCSRWFGKAGGGADQAVRIRANYGSKEDLSVVMELFDAILDEGLWWAWRQINVVETARQKPSSR